MNKIKIILVMLLASFKIQAAAVDLEFSLVIDVSSSITAEEYNIMMDGYASALRNTTIQNNILGGSNGAISINTVFFSQNFISTGLDSFTLLDSKESINAYAKTLDDFARPGIGATAIYNGTNRAIDLLDSDTLFESTRQIIDISGDGISAAFLDRQARDDAQDKGYIINGITIGEIFVNDYYKDNVITEGAFIFHAEDFDEFKDVILDKLITEIDPNPNPNPNPNPVPEPATLALLTIGILGFRFSRKSVK